MGKSLLDKSIRLKVAYSLPQFWEHHIYKLVLDYTQQPLDQCSFASSNHDIPTSGEEMCRQLLKDTLNWEST